MAFFYGELGLGFPAQLAACQKRKGKKRKEKEKKEKERKEKEGNRHSLFCRSFI